MVREEVKKLLPIIQAFAEGKTIECLKEEKWVELVDPSFNLSPQKYRIKPETEFRPFRSQEECLNEMFKHKNECWVKDKSGWYWHVVGIKSSWISFSDVILTYEDAFKKFTFTDGAPFGIEEEV